MSAGASIGITHAWAPLWCFFLFFMQKTAYEIGLGIAAEPLFRSRRAPTASISTTPVIAGDSFEMDAVGALRLSPLRRGLAIDSTVDIFTFYRSEERRVGKECRFWWWLCGLK